MRIDGGCHCGRIAYEVEIDPARVSICHCTDCQMLTGSPFRVTAGAIRLVTGMPRRYAKRGDSGRLREQHFCGDCGTPLFSSGEGGLGDWGIRWGSIRQRSALHPAHQIWCASAVSWIGQIVPLPAQPGD